MAIVDQEEQARRMGVRVERFQADLREGDAAAAGALLAPLEALMRRAKAADALEREVAALRVRPIDEPRNIAPTFEAHFKLDRRGRPISPVTYIPLENGRTVEGARGSPRPKYRAFFEYDEDGAIKSPVRLEPQES